MVDCFSKLIEFVKLTYVVEVLMPRVIHTSCPFCLIFSSSMLSGALPCRGFTGIFEIFIEH